MPNTIESVKQLLRTAVENATGWTTIFGPANGPEPANQYCLVSLKDIETQQHDVIHWTENEEHFFENQRQESSLRFEVQARGSGAMDTLSKVVAYLDSGLRFGEMWNDVGSGGHDSVQSISTYQNGKILPAAVVTIYLHATLPRQNVIDYMNHLDITTKISDNITIGPITVPPEEES